MHPPRPPTPPRRLLKVLAALAYLALAHLVPLRGAGTGPIFVYPDSDKSWTASLDGDWSFKYIPSLDPGADADFYKPDFKVADWKSIPVPSNWELKGFAEPHYDTGLTNGTGLYRRTFKVPAGWRDGRRICLRFEGVAFGFDAWVNGQLVGVNAASAFNQHTFDITDALLAGENAENVLAVQVTTKPFAYEFDVNDDWSLSGIYRDVSLFSVPATHVQDVATNTRLAKDGAADLTVTVTTDAPGGDVRGKLLGPDGSVVSEFGLPAQPDNRYEAVVHVEHPELWTAETPSLYRLELSLAENGKTLQDVEQRVGLREISIANGVLLLNGRPIKLRGVDHHDLDPIDGRAITKAEERRDLELMKKGNINFIRTSHYPPNKDFLELCDEMGFYVMDEVAIGRGESHDNDPAYRDDIMWRVYTTLARDKNHPCVVIWSIGNENPVTDLLLDAGRFAKQIDPARPICYPVTPTVFRQNLAKMPAFVDLLDEHYPTTQELHQLAETASRPVVFSEYAHAWGLAMDGVQVQWAIMQASPRLVGGAVWHFEDQGILRTSPTPLDTGKPAKDVWLDPTHYYDTNKNDGTDGIVYSDRTPQVDFWEVRKVYSPVQIPEGAAAVKIGAQQIPLTVENRFDFRSLAGLQLAWSLRRNGAELAKGAIPLKAASHDQEIVSIPVTIPAGAAGDVLALEVSCFDEKGQAITERSVQLNLADAHRGAWVDGLPKGAAPKVTDNADDVSVAFAGGVLTVARATGELTIKDSSGNVLVAGIYPHCGRMFTLADGRNQAKSGLWPMSILTKIEQPEINVAQNGDAVQISVKGVYPRADKPEQSFTGGYEAAIAANGAISISYDYAPTNAKGELAEAGLSLVLPPALTEFYWIGQGPYPAYPGKDVLDEFGIFHLNRADLRFQGNRRGTELALLTTPTGAGVAVAASPGDIAVERSGDNTLLSQNAVISGLGNKGVPPDTLVESSKTPHIAGNFTLVLLNSTWPAPLTSWFGKPAAARDVFKPYYASYDQ